MTCANVYSIPGMGQPLFGTGFMPARSPLGRVRDTAIGTLMERLFDSGRGTINGLRTSLGLVPLVHTMDQMRRQETLLLIDEAFDFPATFPANVHYAGAQLDDPSWTEPWAPPAGNAPLVLVAMSSSYQAQGDVSRRIAGTSAVVARDATVGYMARTIAQRELRNQNAAIIDAVAKGESFIVTRNGAPVAELRPISGARRRVVPRADLVAMVASGPHIDARQFQNDLETLIDQELT